MWFYAALSMALVSGIITITSKHTLKTISPIILYWAVLVISAPIIFIFAWKSGIPSFDLVFVISILGSITFYSISKIVFFKTIKDAELSHVHPLVALSPLISLALSALILSEKITIVGFIGIGITILGTYVLNISSMRESLLEPFKILFRNKLSSLMLISVVAGGITPVFDKLGITHTFPQNPYFALFIQDFIIVLAFLPWILIKTKTAYTEIKNNKGVLLLLGILGAVSNILAFIALQDGNPGLVASVFRTQVFFVLLFSFIFFKDRPKTETILGSVIMIVGLVVIKLWS